MAITISGSGIVEANLADNAVTLAKMASGTDGEILTYDASGNPTSVSVGTDGQVLTSTGVGSPPAFETAAAGGKVLQVVTDTDNTAADVSADTWTTTGCGASITPSSTSNKILVTCTWGSLDHTNTSNYSGNQVRVLRGTTEVYISGFTDYDWTRSGGGMNAGISCAFLDIPNTTSATTYTMEFKSWNVAGGINDQTGLTGSIIILQEIGV
jgi:hypothetical protein